MKVAAKNAKQIFQAWIKRHNELSTKHKISLQTAANGKGTELQDAAVIKVARMGLEAKYGPLQAWLQQRETAEKLLDTQDQLMERKAQ
jgi:hypothetical protein